MTFGFFICYTWMQIPILMAAVVLGFRGNTLGSTKHSEMLLMHVAESDVDLSENRREPNVGAHTFLGVFGPM